MLKHTRLVSVVIVAILMLLALPLPVNADKQVAVTVNVWCEKSDSEGYSCSRTITVYAEAGTEFGLEDLVGKQVCGKDEHSHNHGECSLNCSHNHELTCYGFAENTTEFTIDEETQGNFAGLTGGEQNGYIYRYFYNDDETFENYYCLRLNEKYYKYAQTPNTKYFDEYDERCEITVKKGSGLAHYYKQAAIAADCTHTEHTDECYGCGLKAHTHSDSCNYEDSSDLIDNAEDWKLVSAKPITVSADGNSVFNVYFDKISETGYFSLIHVQGGKVSEPDKIEITDDIQEYGYTLTDKVSTGFLYGGTFSDSECNTAYSFSVGESGLGFTPKSGETYYIREIAEKYLEPKTFCAYWTNDQGEYEVVSLYLLTPLDVLQYSEAGFTIDGSDMKSVDDSDNIAYSEIKITYTRNPNRTDLLYVSDGEIKQKENYQEEDEISRDAGYIAAYQLTDEQFKAFKEGSLTFQPYWITLDGVKVTGVKSRTCKYLSNSQYIEVINTTVGSKCSAVAVEPVLMMAALSYDIVADPEPVSDDVIIKVNDNGSTSEIVAQVGDNFRSAITPAGAKGKLFAGWYTDEGCTRVADLSDLRENITIYAKYVSNRYLRLKFVQRRFFGSGLCLFTTVDSDQYIETGFIVGEEVVKADYIGLNYGFNSKGPFLKNACGRKENLIMASWNGEWISPGSKITVTPYWITQDGTTVYGTAQTLKYTKFRFR